MKFTFKFSLALAACALVGLIASTHYAQEKTQESTTPEKAIEIEIVNKDGEKVIPIFQDEKAKAGAKTGAMSATIGQDGKIIITDDDGKIRELDTTGAQSIIVNRSSKSVSVNGENKTLTFGKAIIIGPDGERREITLGTPTDGVTDLLLPGLRGTMTVDRVDDSFVVGVHCEPVGDAIRSQLELESGLIVERVVADSPAQASGIQKHDILMFADDRELKSHTDLIEMVQTAGKEKNKLTFTALRAGKEISVEVAPVERPASDPAIEDARKMLFRFAPDFGDAADMRFRHLGPGVIVGGGPAGGFFGTDEAMKQVEEEMEKMRKEMKEFRKQMREEMGKKEIEK